MDNLSIEGKLHQTVEEGNRYDEILNTLLELSKKAEKEGLLALDDLRMEPLPPVLRQGIRFICAGYDPEEIKSKLSADIDACSLTASERREALLIRDGLLILQSGEGGRELKEKLETVWGQELFKESKRIETSERGLADSKWTTEKISPPVAEEKSDFKDTILAIQDSEEIERWLRITGYSAMGLALKTVNLRVFNHFVSHINMRSKNELIEVMAAIGPCREVDVIDSQQKVLRMSYFNQVISWNRMDLHGAQEVLFPYTEAMKNIVRTLCQVSPCDYRKLERFFCDGRSLANMCSFFQAVVDNDVETYKIRVIPLLEKELLASNCYNEELWILWRRYLQDALDVLTLLERNGTKERLERILEAF